MLKRVAVTLFIAFILFLSFVNLDRVPPVWWDEGWTIDVAKNWVEHGHYGHYLNGEPAPPDLAAGFPTVVSVALIFKLLGVGIWQARLPGVLFGLSTLALLYLLGRQLFNRRVGIGSIIFAVLVSSSTFLNPILVSRQILAEMPMLFFLLSGYLAFWLALRRSSWFILLAMALWGLALITKAQVLPFWIASFGVPLVLTTVRRHWRLAALLLIGLIGGYVASQAWLMLQAQILQGQLVAPAIPGLFDITAFVVAGSVRSQSFLIAALVGLPTVFGLIYVVIKCLRERPHEFPDSAEHIISGMLWALASSWLAWYVLLSIGWERYIMPSLFVGSIFVSVIVQDVLIPTDPRQLLANIRRRHSRTRTLGALCLLLSLILSISVGVALLSNNIRMNTSDDLQDVAAFINTQTAIKARIETFDSEVFFFLARRYHYPPSVTQVEAVRRLTLHQAVPISYDPLAANPDYLVIGPFSQGWHVYDAVLAAGAFRSVYANNRYIVYERVR